MKRHVAIIKLMTCVTLFALISTSASFAGEDNLTGILSMADDGMVLNTDNGTYVLVGQAISTDLVGKRVKVNGTILETDEEEPKVISVDACEAIN